MNAPIARPSGAVTVLGPGPGLPGADAPPLDARVILRRRTRIAFAVLALLVGLMVLLGTVLRANGAVVPPGDVAVESRVKSISHPTGGVLGELLVRDGSRVRAGDVLMVFDTSVSGPQSRLTDNGLDQLIARRGRLEAERDNRASISFPPGFAARTDPAARELRAREEALFRIRREERLGSRSLLGERVRQLENLIVSYDAQIGAARRQLELIGPELDGLRGLFDKKLVTINRLNNLERQAIELEGTIAARQADIAQARARIAETREQMLQVDQSVRADSGVELSEVVRQQTDQQIRRAQATDTLTRAVVRAPQSGVIDKLQYTTIGSAVPAGQPLAQLVPDADTLLIEARVRPDDIDEVAVGQAARVRLSTLNRERTPEVTGKVSFVAAESSEDERQGYTYYRISVTLDPVSDDTAAARQLKAGMPVEVFLTTGSRSLLSWLVKPLVDQFSHSFRSG